MTQISSGEWQQNPHLTDYRSQLLDKMYVERARWRSAAPTHRLGDTVVAAPGYISVRFWLLDGEEPIEKYFDIERKVCLLYTSPSPRDS